MAAPAPVLAHLVCIEKTVELSSGACRRMASVLLMMATVMAAAMTALPSDALLLLVVIAIVVVVAGAVLLILKIQHPVGFQYPVVVMVAPCVRSIVQL